MIKTIKVYDLDGCLINSLHRYRTDATGKNIDLPYWRKYDRAKYIARDTLLPLAEDYKKDLDNPETYVICATARACSKNDANYKFLRNILGFPNKFVHRDGPDDNRGGAQLKIEAIKPLLNLKQFKNASLFVYEDNHNYLRDLCHGLNAEKGFYIPSKQGH